MYLSIQNQSKRIKILNHYTTGRGGWRRANRFYILHIVRFLSAQTRTHPKRATCGPPPVSPTCPSSVRRTARKRTCRWPSKWRSSVSDNSATCLPDSTLRYVSIFFLFFRSFNTLNTASITRRACERYLYYRIMLPCTL